MPVPTTQTVIDAQREHKEIREKITVLKVEHDKSEREHQDTLHATEGLREEQKRIAAELATDRDHTFRLLKEAQETAAQALVLLKLADAIGERSLEFVSALSREMDAIRAGIESGQKQKEQMHEEIVEEQRRIGIKQRDLEIYEQRLNTRIAEAGLQGEINVIL